jgi:hypothetical protein
MAMDRDDSEPAGWRLHEAASELVRDTPEGRALEQKLEAFGRLDDTARKRAARDIQEDIANIVARAVTEEHQRTQMLNALANFRNDQTVAVSTPSEIQEQHPLVVRLLQIVEEVLEEVGKEMLIEAVLPGAHILIPPKDFVESVFTTVEMFEIAQPAQEIAELAQPSQEIAELAQPSQEMVEIDQPPIETIEIDQPSVKTVEIARPPEEIEFEPWHLW